MSTNTNASAIVGRIESRLTKKGVSKTEFCKATGISISSLSQWRNDQYYPSREAVLSAADYLKVSDTWLLTGIEDKEIEYFQVSEKEKEMQAVKLMAQLENLLKDADLSENEQRLLSIYRSAPEQGKAFLLNAAEMVESAYLGKNNQPESVEAAS